MQNSLFTVLFAIWIAKKCKLALRGVFADLSEPAQIQLNRLYLLCALQFGEIRSANKLIFTVLFTIWRAKKSK